MWKVISFIAGLLSGVILMFALYVYLGMSDLIQSPAQRALSDRMESIPIETICNSIVSHKEILGDDHVTVWTDKRRYIIAGWTMEKSSVPVFYWTGADIPKDVAECKGAAEP